MSLKNAAVNNIDGTLPPRTSVGSRASWAPLLIGVLSAVIVGSPSAGSALGMAFVAGLAALALALSSKAGFEVHATRSSGGLGILIGTCVVVVALATCSIVGAVSGALWVSWTAAIATFLVTTLGLWLTARRNRTAA